MNALIALAFAPHEFHERVVAWLQREGLPALATCAITELGFLRVLSQSPLYGVSLLQAQTLLNAFRQTTALNVTFISDNQILSRLPRWVKAPTQLTDGHLVQLATANDASLATLDENIPAAYLIPRNPSR